MSVEEFIKALPATMSKGQKALEALSVYRAARQPVPDAVLREIDNCYRHFTEGKPVTAFRSTAIRNEGAPLTLGQAFGVPDIKGGEKTALKRRRLALAASKLVALFSGSGGLQKVPVTREGFATVAEKTGLTVSEIEDWESKYKPKNRTKKTFK